MIYNKRNIIFIIIIILFTFILKLNGNKDYHVIIDAGHGGEDGGTIGVNGALEKDINLEIASKLARKLKRRSFKVSMIRETDYYYSLEERVAIANDLNGDILISIHCNATENNLEAEGIEILYYPNKDNYIKADILLNNLKRSTKAEAKGIIERPNLVILRDTKIPSFIIETGFLSNRKEAELLCNNIYQKKIVKGIFKGILEISKKSLIIL